MMIICDCKLLGIPCLDLLKVCFHVTFFSPSPLSPIKFSIVSMVTVWLADRMGDGPIFSFILVTEKRTHLVTVVIPDTG